MIPRSPDPAPIPRRRATGVLAAFVVALAPALVLAPSSARADAAGAQILFDEALNLMKQGRFDLACPKLEESQRLDPGLGTQYRLAECYEGAGKFASAWALFVEVTDSARRSGMQDRAGVAEKRAATLAPHLRRLKIVVSAEAAATPGLVVKRNGDPVGAALLGQPVPVDAEVQQVEASAPGHAPFSAAAKIPEGATAAVTVPALELDANASGGSHGSTQRTVGIVIGAIGLAGAAAGGIFGIVASSTWNGALKHCQGGAHDACDAEGVSAGSRANTFANVSNVGLVAGGVLAATGVVVFVLAPRDAPATQEARLSFGVAPGGFGARFGGTF